MLYLVGAGGSVLHRRYGLLFGRRSHGWAVRQELWGRGYGTEIGQAALRLAFGDLRVSEVASFAEGHLGVEQAGARERRLSGTLVPIDLARLDAWTDDEAESD